ncbi:50S ribosomal protein L10 [Candidatus Peregrinibacteria bacterium]|nr:50S ribosomal protein L10 [Candidatus Peregrinibacteria bacterium]
MALTKDQKKGLLDKVTDRLKKAKSVVFSGYSGINVKSMTGLRKQLRSQKIDYLIIKKTLLKIGAKDAKLPEIDESMLKGPIAVAISYEDEIAPIKILYAMSRDKNFEKKLELYGGIMEGKILSKEEVMTLATIPSKQELIAKLVYIFKSPVSRFHFVLHEIVRKFVGTMDALKEKKPADTTPKAASPKTEVTVEAPKVEVAPTAEVAVAEAAVPTVAAAPVETTQATETPAEMAAPAPETPTNQQTT